MSNQELELDELKDLDEQIRYHANLFFVKNISEISDSEYDDMVIRFNELAAKYPDSVDQSSLMNKLVPISLDGGELNIVKFDTPMLGLKKIYDKQLIEDFVKSIKGPVVYEYKMDGLALEVRYVDGLLTGIFTRGDSLEGEDVTHCHKLFGADQIPLKLPEPITINVRGEGYITLKNFDYFNSAAPEPAKTMRNAVSGWVRTLPSNMDPLVEGLLSFGVYWSDNNLGKETYTGVIDTLGNWGFGKCPRIDRTYIVNDIRAKDIPVDGVVVKADSIDEHAKLGYATKVLNWSVAYKFPGVIGRTKLLDVVWQVGGSGVVIPVAIYRPVNILGADNTRATVHSYKEFKDLCLTDGCEISIIRSGDCIPHIHQVFSDTGGKVLKAPKTCPSCSSLLVIDGAHLTCPNTASCPGQLIQRCVNLVDKKGFDIVGLSVLKLTKLVNDGYISRTSHIFDVPMEMWDAAVQKSLKALKDVPLNKFIKALSLPNVGEQTAKRIAISIGDNTGNILGLLTDISFLRSVDGVGLGTAMDINATVVNPEFIHNFNQLMVRVKVIPLVTSEITHKVCVTGKVGVSRTELTNYLGEEGIEVSKSVTKDCNLVVLGSDYSSGKVDKANKLDIPIVSMDQYSTLSALRDYIKELK